MKQLTTNVAFMLALLVLMLTAVSCAKSPNVQQQSSTVHTVSVERDEAGSVVVLLIGKGDDGVWKKKDKSDDILVERTKGNTFNIKMNLTLPNGGTQQIQTRIKALPGEKVLIGGDGEKKIYIELQ